MAELYDRAAETLSARLSEPAYAHSVRVAETAAALAMIYGVDVDDARLAGLLHDWDRELGREGLLDAAQGHGLPLEAIDEASPYLIHARSGAASVKREFPGVGVPVLDAISRHTLGSAEMTDLDMVVYLADMLEPGRDYDGVEALREAAGNVALEELFALGYQQSVAYLVRERRRIHPDTVAVWNARVARSQR